MNHENQDNITQKNQSCQIKRYTMSSLYIWSDQNKTWQNQSHYAKQGKMNNQHNQHINVSNKYSNEAREKSSQSKSSIKVNNHHNRHVNVPNEYNNQACIQWRLELSIRNQETSIHWPTNQTPHLPQFMFKLDPLKVSPMESPFYGPRISAQCVSH